LLGKLGLVEINLFALALFALLTGFSHLWLSVYQLGPAEWLWRSAVAASGPVQKARSRRAFPTS
jgi:uncharacterized membrane protein YeiB